MPAASRLRDGVVGDQPARPADLVHDLVAGIDAERALDALELRAVADVDAGRADRHACRAVDAVAAPLPGLPRSYGAARLAAPGAIGDRERVVVEHARPGCAARAHVDADLLAGDAAEHVGGGGEDADEDVGERCGAVESDELGAQASARRRNRTPRRRRWRPRSAARSDAWRPCATASRPTKAPCRGACAALRSPWKKRSTAIIRSVHTVCGQV